MSIALVLRCFMVSHANPLAHSLSVVICVVPCGHPISSKELRIGQASCPLTKVAAISASAAEATVTFKMLATMCIGPLIVGGGLFGPVSAGLLR